MPTRNRPHLTQLAVRQFLEQTYTPRELIIVEDGDNDLRPWLLTRLKHRVSNFATNLNRFGGMMQFRAADGVTIKYFRAEASTGKKLNLAAEVADGEFLFRFDSDDWWRADRLAQQMEHFRISGAAMVGLSSIVFYQEGRPHGWLWSGLSCDPLGASQGFRRDWFLANPAPDQSLAEDSAVARKAHEQGVLFSVSGLNGLIVARDHDSNTGVRSEEWERESPNCESFYKVELGGWYEQTVKPWVSEPLECTPVERVPKLNFADLEVKMQAHNKAARARGMVRTAADEESDIEIRYKLAGGEHKFLIKDAAADRVALSLGDVERLMDLYRQHGFEKVSA